MTADFAMPDPATLAPVPLAGADLQYSPRWLDAAAADALQAALLEQIPWDVHRIRLFGREVASPRLSCWIGDPGAAYRYSGALFAPQPWPPALRTLRGRLESACGARLPASLLGVHSSTLPALGKRLNRRVSRHQSSDRTRGDLVTRSA